MNVAGPKQSPGYIRSPDGPLFSVFHHPYGGDVDAMKPAVLVCSPWGWNETVSYHSRRDWAEILAGEGHPVLRFDLATVGDSAGSPYEAGTLDRWVGSVSAAAAWLGAAAPGREIAALGLELGGILALEAARRGAAIDALALWAMPRDGRGFVRLVQAFSRMQTWGGGPDGDSPLPPGALEAAGFVLGADTVSELRALKPLEGAPPAGVRRALVLGRDAAAPDEELAAYLRGGGAEVEMDAGPGWDDLVSHPGYTVAPPLTMRRTATWLAAESREHRGDPSAPPSSGSTDSVPERSIEVDGARESVFDGLPEQTFGILGEPPEAPDAETCVVFLNAGYVRHIGPSRLWLEAARELAAAGVRSLRIDCAAIGEADGDGSRFAEVSEFFEGPYGAQIKAVLDALEGAGVARRFILVGLCSGGYWGFRLGIGDPRVDHVLLLNPGALHWRSSLIMERDDKGAGLLVQGHLWKKLLGGEIGLGKMRAFGLLLWRRLREAVRGRKRGRRSGTAAPAIERDRALERDLDALRDAGTTATVAFSANERTGEEMDEAGIPEQLGRWPNLRIVDLPGVDHALASTSAQEAARALIEAEVRAALPQVDYSP